MLQKARDTALRISNRVGLSPVIRNGRWRSGRLLILAYHGISLEDEHEWNPGLYIHPEVFRQRLALLKAGGYEVLPLDEAFRLLRANRLPSRCVTITFDDGFYDFHKHAAPILREFDYPATVFLSTYYSRYNKPVFDIACSYILWKGRGIIADGEGIVDGNGQMDLRTPVGRLAALTEIRAFAARQKLSGPGKDELAATVAWRVGVDYEELLAKRILHLMTPNEVSKLPGDRVAIELHTHRHRAVLDRSAFMKEIADNRSSIQSMTGSSSAPVHFCYPSGVHKRQFLPWLQDAGIVSATTCAHGLASRRSNPLLLPRLLDSSTLSPIQFEGWLTGLASFLPRRPTSMHD
jgi:peptidoglycan/xylan/chitin deacetylase (PgdA/CDA1 family)